MGGLGRRGSSVLRGRVGTGAVDGDGQVNPVDSGLVRAAFCTGDDCGADALCQYDLDCDAQINPVDAGIVQSLYGTCDPPRDACP